VELSYYKIGAQLFDVKTYQCNGIFRINRNKYVETLFFMEKSLEHVNIFTNTDGRIGAISWGLGAVMHPNLTIAPRFFNNILI